jgi:hypothetical protein
LHGRKKPLGYGGNRNGSTWQSRYQWVILVLPEQLLMILYILAAIEVINLAILATRAISNDSYFLLEQLSVAHTCCQSCFQLVILAPRAISNGSYLLSSSYQWYILAARSVTNCSLLTPKQLAMVHTFCQSSYHSSHFLPEQLSIVHTCRRRN